jgi:hypothetical protein
MSLEYVAIAAFNRVSVSFWRRQAIVRDECTQVELQPT